MFLSERSLIQRTLPCSSVNFILRSLIRLYNSVVFRDPAQEKLERMSGSVEPENNRDRKPKSNVHRERENVAEDLHDKRESEEAVPASEDAGDVFFSANVPPWLEQITLRGIAASVVMGGLFCIIAHKLNLTVGAIPSLSVAAGLVGFFMIKTWTTFLAKFGLLKKPFTRQENTVIQTFIQTCVVACYGIAFSGGFGTYIVAMDEATRQKTGPSVRGNDASAVKTPHLGWIFAFIFAVSFLGLFAVVPLRKIMIIDYKLTYPSGTATAVLINSFHTPQGQAKAKMQVLCLAKYFIISFLWSFFKWFFSGNGDCGFKHFPIFGLKAFENKFYTDFNATYVGAGMICPHLVNISMLFGGIVSWGLMWPLIKNREGDWFPAGLSSKDLKGLYGYKIIIAMAILLGDGIYNFVKILTLTIFSLYQQHKRRGQLPVANSDINNPAPDESQQSLVERKRNEIFMKGSIPFHVAATAYVTLAAISTGVMPRIFHQVKWYYVLSGYVVAPILGFCNSYGSGLTDWSLPSNYGKLGLFIFAAWAGSDGGVIAGLALMGVMMVIVTTASDLMQDFKTGYLTMASPRSMFASQIIGTAMGCILAPLTFWMFWKAFDIGVSKEYPAPNAAIFRQMALLGIDGFSALPKHCLQLCYGFFAFAMITNLIKDFVPKKVSAFIPISMAMAIPFYVGPYFAIDMFVGTVIVFVWTKLNKPKADLLVPAVASGLISGDALWALPSAVLAIAKKSPPLCMTFLSRTDAAAILQL